MRLLLLVSLLGAYGSGSVLVADANCATKSACLQELHSNTPTAAADCSTNQFVLASPTVNKKGRTTYVHHSSTDIPYYASACNAKQYASACSCLGIPKRTSTFTSVTPVTTPQIATSPTVSASFSNTTYTNPSTLTTTTTPVTVSPSIVLPTTTNVTMVMPMPTKPISYAHTYDDNSTTVADLSFTALDGSAIVNLEELVPFIHFPSCRSNAIALLFENPQAYTLARSSWTSHFILITSSIALCGVDDGSRTFYNVTSTDFEVSDNSVVLYITALTVDQAFGTMAFNLTTTPTPTARESGSKVRDTYSTASKALSYDLGLLVSEYMQGLLSGLINIDHFVQDGSDSINYDPINCDNCGMTGTLTLTAFGVTDWTNVDNSYATLSADISDLGLYVDFSYSTQGDYTVSKSFTLFSADLPSVSLPGKLVVIDPSAIIQASVSLTATGGSLEIENIGFSANLPDSSVSISTKNGAAASGWNLGSAQVLKPAFDYTMPDEWTFTAGIGPVISFDLGLGDGFFKLDGSLELDSPNIIVDFTKGCNGNPSGWNTEISAEVKFTASAGASSDVHAFSDSYSWTPLDQIWVLENGYCMTL